MNKDCNSLNISNDLPYDVRSARFIEYFEAYLADSLSSLERKGNPLNKLRNTQ